MEQIIFFTADDLGLDEKTNLAIERAHRQGALNAASLMLGQPGTGHALEIIRRNPELQIGWHFHACDSRPLTCERWPWGNSPLRAGVAAATSRKARILIRRELSAQWEQFQVAGVPCRFINGHHHIHIHPFIAQEMHAVISSFFNGWVRGFEANFFGTNQRGSPGYRWLRRLSVQWLKAWPNERRSHSLWGLDRTFAMQAEEVRRVLPELGGGRHEFLFHPRTDNDPDQRALLALRDWRV